MADVYMKDWSEQREETRKLIKKTTADEPQRWSDQGNGRGNKCKTKQNEKARKWWTREEELDCYSFGSSSWQLSIEAINHQAICSFEKIVFYMCI